MKAIGCNMALWLGLALCGLACQSTKNDKDTGTKPEAPPKTKATIDVPPSAATTSNSKVPIDVYFTKPNDTPNRPGDIADQVVQRVNSAQSTIDVAAFELDNLAISQALASAAQRGVKVRLVTDTDYIDESGVALLKQNNVPVVDDRRDGSLMHDKFMVFDNRAVWTGSMNFTENCAYKNNNNGIYIEDSNLAENYSTKFKWMFEEKKFGGAPSSTAKIPHPRITLSDGTKIANYFSTHDHIMDQLLPIVKKANKSIHFLAFSFTHKALGEAVRQKAYDGLDVRGVFEKSQAGSSYSQYNVLKKAGIPVYQDVNSRNMHHKVIILDERIVVAGSYNFSDSADKSNDENVIIIDSPQVAKLFEEEFRRVYDPAKLAMGD